ncbi:hypothetical protein MNBD_ACTINO02-461 [hydrothermal vent metagenome]|uniref:Mycothiol-dependent maleylpyruvate isomerase metal-binding domain-containing protein n=1 Tax=hydrothermal vent metagenome TaxID=652676 RepID=A0A3B0SXL2_9ZZZZ
MDWNTYLDAIATDTKRLHDIALSNPDLDLETCPGWTVTDVVAHLGRIHRRTLDLVNEGLTDRFPDPVDAPERDVVAWAGAAARDMVSALAGIDPTTPLYTWHTSNQTAGFWMRRMAHETAIHRLDAEIAVGDIVPFEREFAADCVAEVLEVLLTGCPPWGTWIPFDKVVYLACTDVEASWMLELGAFEGTSPTSGRHYEELPGMEFVTGVDDPDVVITGSAYSLASWIWGRGSLATLDIDGDLAVAMLFRSAAADAT